ncbi:MAG: proton-conducting transporter membrane subunit [Pseudomonadota bacterium]
MTPANLPVLAVALPLILAMLAPWLGRVVWPLYALAGLTLVAAGLMPGGGTEIPGLVLGMTLASDPTFGPVLAGSGAVWAASALHARGSMADGPGDGPSDGLGDGLGDRGGDRGRARVFACLFGLAMAGNALLLLAEDMVSFYVGYSVMSLSAWGLVAHRRTPASNLAAQVYLAFAVAGELCLFAALMLIDAAQDSLLTPRALSSAPPEAAVWFAIAAFGVKAGLAPLHLWLPLAHPAAPVPASAALSGAMLKAGIVGALKLAPPGLLAPAAAAVAQADGSVAIERSLSSISMLGDALVLLGLFGAFAAGLYGALTGDRKTVLAYSSVSQLSLALALLGAGYAGYADAGLVAGSLALFALHHALAKGALFLCVDSGLPRALAIAAFVIAALALTGMPLTLGEVSKRGFEAALAAGLETGRAAPADLVALFAAAAFATALVMARATSLPWPTSGARDPWRGMAVLALTAGCVGAAWPEAAMPPLQTMPKALAPGLALLAAAALLARLPVLTASLPAGDLLNLIPALRPSRRVAAHRHPAPPSSPGKPV